MTDPLLNSASKAALGRAAAGGVHALIISGPKGVGLAKAARYFGEKLNGTVQTIHPTDSKSEKIDLENGTVTVESMRRLYEQTRAATPRAQVVVISQAERMSPAAQGAFLKLLEEPRDRLHFVLLSSEPQRLLPTIRSRTQTVVLQPVSASESRELLSSLGVTDSKKLTQMLFIGGGLPEELTRLASDDEYFEAEAALALDAKQLLQAPLYDKLVLVNKYREDRARALDMLDKAAAMLHVSLSRTSDAKLAQQLDKLLLTETKLRANGNVRLNLARFVLQ